MILRRRSTRPANPKRHPPEPIRSAAVRSRLRRRTRRPRSSTPRPMSRTADGSPCSCSRPSVSSTATSARALCTRSRRRSARSTDWRRHWRTCTASCRSCSGRSCSSWSSSTSCSFSTRTTAAREACWPCWRSCCSGSTGRGDRHRRAVLVILGVFGTALLYGDGIITPAISVLGAVEGLKIVAPALEQFVVAVTIGSCCCSSWCSGSGREGREGVRTDHPALVLYDRRARPDRDRTGSADPRGDQPALRRRASFASTGCRVRGASAPCSSR